MSPRMPVLVAGVWQVVLDTLLVSCVWRLSVVVEGADMESGGSGMVKGKQG